MRDVTKFSILLYRWLARGFPEEFLHSHGDDMMQLSEDLIRQAAAREKLSGFLPLFLRLLLDLLWRSMVEHGIALRQDFLYGARALRRSPALTLACTASLAIGIGMSTSTYQQIRSFYFQNTPGVGDAEGLFRLEGRTSYPNYEAFRDHSGKFSSMAAYLGPVPFLMNVNSRTERVWGHLVTPNYFNVLNASMSLGSGFRDETRHRDAAPEVVVSRRFWENRLGADRNLLGHQIQVNGRAALLVGVARDNFLGASPLAEVADLWIPVSSQQTIAPELAAHPLEDRRIAAFQVFGRLQPGVTIASAEAALDALVRRLEEENHDPDRERKGRRATLLPGGRLLPMRDQDRVTASSLPVVLIGLLLWVACANVATLLLARAAGRRKEIAVRLALGASRWRIVRQLLTESLMLSLIGAGAGFIVVYWSNASMDWLRPVLPEYMSLQVETDWTAIVFAVAIGAVTGVLFGLAPALHATRGDIVPALHGGQPRLPAFRWFSTRNLLVLQQLAGSLMLLLLTGFVMTGMQRSTALDLGFDTHHLYRMSLDPVREGYTAATAPEFLRKVLERVRSQPGVESAALGLSAPLEPFGASVVAFRSSRLKSSQAPAAERSTGPLDPSRFTSVVETVPVGSGFFETAGISVLGGRTFRDEGQKEETQTAVVNETLANSVFQGKNAIGEILELDDQRLEIIGVVKDVRTNFILNIPTKRAYVPLTAERLGKPGPRGVALLVRTAPGVVPDVLVRQAVSSIDSNLTVFDISSMDDRVAEMLSAARVGLVIYAAIGTFCLLLAVLGIAGVTAYAVAQRRREIGIRMALGAERHDILRLVMREGTVLVIGGTVLGAICGYGVLRVLNRILAVIAQITTASTSDPRLWIGAPLLLAVLALMACYFPARGSTRIDPMEALRQD